MPACLPLLFVCLFVGSQQQLTNLHFPPLVSCKPWTRFVVYLEEHLSSIRTCWAFQKAGISRKKKTRTETKIVDFYAVLMNGPWLWGLPKLELPNKIKKEVSLFFSTFLGPIFGTW
jgi:hypothetical protein